MSFEEECSSMGGEIKEVKDPEMEVCVLEEKEMAITEDGRTVPIEV